MYRPTKLQDSSDRDIEKKYEVTKLLLNANAMEAGSRARVVPSPQSDQIRSLARSEHPVSNIDPSKTLQKQSK